MVRLEQVLIGETLALVGELEHGLKVLELKGEAAGGGFAGGGGIARGEGGEPEAVEPFVPVGMVFAEEGEVELVGFLVGGARPGVVAQFAPAIADPSHGFGDLDVGARSQGRDASLEHLGVERQRLLGAPRGPFDFAEEKEGLKCVGMGRSGLAFEDGDGPAHERFGLVDAVAVK